ncbi:GNAT family N-acetyltransferase [Sulfitobacter sp. M57]|uniref:GNAT family N-acetyltransferase n=1 Tax=unclassified Sulfitobacter TaxID=196795 RepID=UPI0023E2F0C1|nr:MULTISPECIES: GNAT family N-acetyltransferase [unclassified Sulfitobacter]MDF3414617.1 GNAT family N-acetyltransferase [Sulfitobacter sp. KE5]MDF3422099.1 GNAT family N-acetyltransferase [Sulfitobacter sp. KE43]MDF3433164.1 GNAT family N-acetyltransferase [Sulfitobacter sp. KE42]MDF3458804.1 GNAT family N-acetyltransferase [Sulfitobacter sp. S74]MDF3462703.1 GNAT family N-acetyltransferase [Sulfitobacter sp. Ks18]
MTELAIRNVQAADLPRVQEMVRKLAAHHGDVAQVSLTDLERDCLGAEPWLRVLVAVRGVEISGYAALCSLVQMQFGVRGMDMHHLFVSEEARGIGVGRALIDASVALTKSLGCRYMTVGTHPENKAAAMIYQVAGFEPLPSPGPRFRIRF